MHNLKIIPAYPQLQKGARFNLLAINDMANVLFYTKDKQALIRNLQKLWKKPSNRFSYQNTMVAMVNEQPAGAISCLPYSELQQQTFTTVWQIAKIQKLQLIPQFLHAFKDIIALIRLDEGNTDEYHVSMLATLSQFRGMGVGRALLEYAEQLALHKGYTKISLTVEVENTTAQRLYTKQGYKVIGQSGNNHVQVYKMRKMIK
ncbi:GNAT family N-acetyltransferase [Staphylococcus sp. KG4-3]|uniref:N-acetyltransferase n=1 Tax=Staphylococcus xylosus TaxID=1288 RepID=A0A418IP36_STAXY|nr:MULTISPECIES: N-acetyltransferase [Staphylococcus]MDW8543327.1 N-acetyltransferase [Staphylococcus sp. KG4-1]MDW8562748.1 N-acetyltransferase [Staphylococcus sp. KG4-3]PTI09056.1 GNAT family N-acetyltransferase [Staphylococcus xylosus]RIN11113.1 N-acetyltransferase [Staphylococcus xylosus]